MLTEGVPGDPVAVGIGLLDVDEHIHVVVALGGDIEMQIHEAGQLGVLVEDHIELGLAGVAVVGDVGLIGDGGVVHGEVLRVGGVKIELLVLGALEGELLLGAALLIVAVVGVHDVDAHARGHLPAVVDALQVTVVELLEVLKVLRIVGIGPLEIAVGTEPFQLAAAAAEGVDGAAEMEVGEAGGLVDRAGDLREVGDLVLPIAVHQRILDGHVDLAVDAAGTGDLGGDELVEGKRRNAALEEALTIQVGGGLPGGDALQVRRLHGSDAPLMHGDAGVAAHTDIAVAPPLLAEPLDEVVAVLAVLVGEHVDIALAVAGAADVDVGYGVALIAPVQRIGGLKLRQLRHGVGRNAHDLPLAHAFAGTLAEPAPGDDGGILLAGVRRTEDVAVDGDAVAHLDGDILVAHDAGRGLVSALVEGGAEALAHAGHRVLAGAQVNAGVDAGRLTGDHIDGLDLLALEGLLQGETLTGCQLVVMIALRGLQRSNGLSGRGGRSLRGGGGSRGGIVILIALAEALDQNEGDGLAEGLLAAEVHEGNFGIEFILQEGGDLGDLSRFGVAVLRKAGLVGELVGLFAEEGSGAFH